MLVVDDHPVFRSGLVRAVNSRPDLEVVGDVGDGRAALDAVETLRPDAVVLDVRMPEQDGFAVLGALRARGREVPALLLTGYYEAESLHAALAAGASGFLTKTSSHEVICDAIAAVARGEVRFPPEMLGALAADIRSHAAGSDRPSLSERELEVLRLTAGGRSAAEIAGDLQLSVATIRTHLQNLYQKLGVSDRAAAVASGLRLGLID